MSLIKTVEWAELVTIDLSRFDQPGGKEQLVQQLDHAVKNVGEICRIERTRTPANAA